MTNDPDCTAFLQWALPQLELRWPGFRKVRGQVCKRIRRRMSDLGIADLAGYRALLETCSAEWHFLDECCHVTISRFFRDTHVFEVLRRQVLPDIAARAKREGREARIWSAGCASGEETYTLKILWDLEIARAHRDVPLSLVATDIDATMLARAGSACFEATSLRELPPHLVQQAFDRVGDLCCVKPLHREGIDFLHQDLRTQAPSRGFDLILCRYVAFTYFSLPLQRRVLGRIVAQLLPSGYLAIGTHEQLPGNGPRLTPLRGAPQIFQKAESADHRNAAEMATIEAATSVGREQSRQLGRNADHAHPSLR